jgi:hypothetical protein
LIFFKPVSFSRRSTGNPRDARSPRDGAQEVYPGQAARGAAASRAYPLAGHPITLEDKTLRRVPTIWTDNRIDGHETHSRRAAGGHCQVSPPAQLLRSYSPPQPFADELCSLDKGVELVLRDVSLEQDETAVSRDSKPLGRDYP